MGVRVDVVVAVKVDEAVGVEVAEGRFVDVGVRVFVDGGSAVAVGVRVGEAISVLVADGRFVAVHVGVRVGEAVAVGVSVGEAVGAALPTVRTSCGGEAPSRDENVTPSVPSATRANVYVPLPVTRVVTSYSTHVFVAMLPLLSNALLSSAGLVFQVIPPEPDSIQLFSAR